MSIYRFLLVVYNYYFFWRFIKKKKKQGERSAYQNLQTLTLDSSKKLLYKGKIMRLSPIVI